MPDEEVEQHVSVFSIVDKKIVVGQKSVEQPENVDHIARDVKRMRRIVREGVGAISMNGDDIGNADTDFCADECLNEKAEVLEQNYLREFDSVSDQKLAAE